MVVLVTCKYEEDPIKNEGASVFTRFFLFKINSFLWIFTAMSNVDSSFLF